ncbi:hypothetical protein [Actinomadura rugatobispora]|uniref:Toxin-antitoxin system HicB family antitoxin n=1 Tax=Actinomadura rugatobispora TaxID=1994 RepID=A0ABW1A9G1_9ACTN|nr:hypothetical protein GCM10010200_004770 [Actinomadura rugatobispora]
MDVTPFVDRIRRELAAAAGTAGDDARALAERLTAPLESATRIALLEALSAAADEITRDLAPGSVEVRVRGLDPDFIVTPPYWHEPSEEPSPMPSHGAPTTPKPPVPPVAPEPDEGGRTSRVTLRLPEHLKPRLEEAAALTGLSVNAWLVRAVSAALAGSAPPRPGGQGPATPFGHHRTGWVR